MASSSSSADAAAKARIISHMTNDHQRELSHYLQYWSHLSAPASTGATLTDLSFTTMTIQSASGASHTIPIVPPMTSWSDARLRAISMDQEARRGLGISDIQITEFRSPGTLMTTSMVLILTGLTLIWTFQSSIVPGTVFYDRILSLSPGGARGFMWLQARVTPVVLGVHVIESIYMAFRLKKYDVLRGSALWWKWVSSTFVTGIATHLGLSAQVARKRKVAEEKKH